MLQKPSPEALLVVRVPKASLEMAEQKRHEEVEPRAEHGLLEEKQGLVASGQEEPAEVAAEADALHGLLA